MTDRRPSLDVVLRDIKDVQVRRRLIDMVTSAHERLESGDVDVVLLAARRMACLYTVMRVRGDLNPATSGLVVSDRFMELARPDRADGWTDARVLILDDSVNTGVTVQGRLDRLAVLGVDENIKIDVAVGKAGTLPDVIATRLERSPLLRTSHEIHALSRQFAALFATHRIPYFTDFPVSRELRPDVGTFHEVLANKMWQTVDVSSTAIDGSTNRTYSLLPSQVLLDELFATHPQLAERLELAKVRIFATHSASDVRLRAVPIVSFRPMGVDTLQAWAPEVGATVGDTDTQLRQVVGMFTFVAARHLLRAFTDHLPESCGPVDEDRDIAEIMLSRGVLERLDALADDDGALPDVIDSDGPLADEGMRWEGRHHEPVYDDLVVVGDDLIRSLYRELASAAPTHGRDSSMEAEALITTTTSTSARDQSAHEMRELADRHRANVSTLSLSIDVLNDLGTAVPKHVVKDAAVRRVYRPGEVDAFLDYEELEPGPQGGRLARLESSFIVQLGVVPGLSPVDIPLWSDPDDVTPDAAEG